MGSMLKKEAAFIPEKLMKNLSDSDVSLDEWISMRNKLQDWMGFLCNRE